MKNTKISVSQTILQGYAEQGDFREVIETILHIKVGKLEYKSFEKDSKLEPDKRGIRLDVYIADSNRVFDKEIPHSLDVFLRKHFVSSLCELTVEIKENLAKV